MMVHNGSNSMLVMNLLNVWKLTKTVLIPDSLWLEEIMMKTVIGLGFAEELTGAFMAAEDHATKVSGHLGRQDSIF